MRSENEGFDIWLNKNNEIDMDVHVGDHECINVIHFAPAIQTTFCTLDLHVPHWAQPKLKLV
jgi:hypothetical protein